MVSINTVFPFLVYWNVLNFPGRAKNYQSVLSVSSSEVDSGPHAAAVERICRGSCVDAHILKDQKALYVLLVYQMPYGRICHLNDMTTILKQ